MNKKSLLNAFVLSLAILASLTTHAADNASSVRSGGIPESPVSYSIEVSLNPETRELDGHETITGTHCVVVFSLQRYSIDLTTPGAGPNHEAFARATQSSSGRPLLPTMVTISTAA